MSKVLIVYSSWAGATHEIADEIGKVFHKNSFLVDVKKSNDRINVREYDAFVIGTSIHAGQTMMSFRKFLKNNIKNLNKKPTAIFVDCANMMNDNKKNRDETLAWLKKSIDKYALFVPISIGLFGGAYLTEGEDFNNLNLIIRKMITSMKKKVGEDQKETDFRDWESIRSWAVNLITIILKSQHD